MYLYACLSKRQASISYRAINIEDNPEIFVESVSCLFILIVRFYCSLSLPLKETEIKRSEELKNNTKIYC